MALPMGNGWRPAYWANGNGVRRVHADRGSGPRGERQHEWFCDVMTGHSSHLRLWVGLSIVFLAVHVGGCSNESVEVENPNRKSFEELTRPEPPVVPVFSFA